MGVVVSLDLATFVAGLLESPTGRNPQQTDQPISPLVHGMFGGSLRHFQVREGLLRLVTIQLFKDDPAKIFSFSEP
jgi:hypothetical protein